MRQQIWTGLVVVGSLALTVNCGGDDGNTFSETTTGTDGGTGGGTASASGGTTSDGTTSGGSSGTSGGSGAGGSRAGDPVACPADITNVSTALAEAICEKRTECCEDDQDACVTQVVAALDDVYPSLADSEDDETAALNCTAFDACALAIDEASCGEWPLQSGSLGGLPIDEPECLVVITPKVADGDDCTYNYQCIEGVCSVPENETEGTCSEFANLNAPCGDGCDPTTMFCNDAQVCQLRLPNGASCTDAVQCESRICDVAASGECVAPGPDECKYVPNGAAHCALGAAPGSGTAPYGLLVTALAALGVSVARRRRTVR